MVGQSAQGTILSDDDIFPWYGQLFYILKSSWRGSSTLFWAKILLSYLFPLTWDFLFIMTPDIGFGENRLWIHRLLLQHFPEASVGAAWF